MEKDSPPPLEGGGWGEGLVPVSHLSFSRAPTPPPNLGPLRGPSPQGEGENVLPQSAPYPDAHERCPGR